VKFPEAVIRFRIHKVRNTQTDKQKTVPPALAGDTVLLWYTVNKYDYYRNLRR